MDNVKLNSFNAVNFKASAPEASAVQIDDTQEIKDFDIQMQAPLSQDKLETTDAKAKAEKIAEKQETLQAARAKAAGWSILFGIIDTLYYALRSDKTVAKRFDLDPKEDKAFIKQIKREQALWTLPSCIPYVGLITGIASYAYNKTLDSSKLKVAE